MTGRMLHDVLSEVGADLMIKVLDNLDNIKPEKQDDSKKVMATSELLRGCLFIKLLFY